MITREKAELLRLDAIALRVDQRRKRENFWEAYSFEATPDGAGIVKAHTDAAVDTVARWFKDAGAVVQSVNTEGMQETMTVKFKAAKHDH